ncbi:MAG: hypothetical protein D3926_06060, partial [Desulfobacteraceae bacterium]
MSRIIRKLGIQSSLSKMFIVFTFLLIPNAFANLDSSADSAKVRVQTDQISWEILVPNEGAALRVNGPGSVYYEKVFHRDVSPVFTLKDNAGSLFPDGTCHYELRI